MAAKSAKTTNTSKAPVQTDVSVQEEVKKPVAEVKADTKKQTVKEPEKKAEAPAKEETPAANKVEEKPAPKKRGRKPGSKNSTTRKTTTTTRKTVKKETVSEKTEVFFQYGGHEYSEKSILQKVEAAWEAEGKRISAIKQVKLYVKPEDKRAYYVINEGLKNGSTGAIEL